MDKGNIAKVKDIKLGLQALADSIAEKGNIEGIELTMGVVLAPFQGINSEQAKTIISKFRQALSSFQEEHLAELVLRFNIRNPLEMDILQKAQDSYTAQATPKPELKVAEPEEAPRPPCNCDCACDKTTCGKTDAA